MTDVTASVAATGSAAHQGHVTGFGSKPYRTYVLVSLMVVYTLNFIDRTIMSVVAQPIIDTFSLNDFQWGLLAGPPFAIFYALMGVPIAMWADRSNRVRIICLCIILWSAMTVLCGLATSFLFLLLFRIGVAVGEAGCTPPANSIIGDYYPVRARAGALGVYSMGVTIGGTLAFLFGGPLAGLDGADFGAWINSVGMGWMFGSLDWASVEGWRIAFVAVGAPGILIALVIWVTMIEPPRGYTDPPGAPKLAKAGFGQAFGELMTKPSFWWMSMGAALVAFVGYGLISFQTPFLMRAHGLSVHEASVYCGASRRPAAPSLAAGCRSGRRSAIPARRAGSPRCSCWRPSPSISPPSSPWRRRWYSGSGWSPRSATMPISARNT